MSYLANGNWEQESSIISLINTDVYFQNTSLLIKKIIRILRYDGRLAIGKLRKEDQQFSCLRVKNEFFNL